MSLDVFCLCLQVSRAHILNKATEYIRQMQKGSAQRLGEIDELRKKNELLEEQSESVYRLCVCVHVNLCARG